ncbi:MAG: acetate kinase [Epsilonproteobacteria bacterium]|nr:MAG: acetate kinase [Campylobacterota bacterium]
MKILVLNSGSSSIKFKLFEMDAMQVLASGVIEKIGEAEGRVKIEYGDEQSKVLELSLEIPDHYVGFALMQKRLQSMNIVKDFNLLDAMGHRVVHGGESFHESVVIDADVITQIKKLIPLAPLHNPSNLAGIEVMNQLAPDVRQIAIFDTAFHQTMPESAYLYALPYALYEEEHIRRYGFHGTSHGFVAKAAATYLERPLNELNLITLHLGNGVSAAAIQSGKSVDTTMGMTPLEGLMMGTRSGDIDPAIVLYLQNHNTMSIDEVDILLNQKSGLKGICGVNDMREVIALSDKGDEKANLALEMFTRRLKKQIGAYTALLGYVDAIVFTGGIGEHAAQVREDACSSLEKGLGIVIDVEKNRAIGKGISKISSSLSRVKVLVIPTDEEQEIAVQTQNVLMSMQNAV